MSEFDDLILNLICERLRAAFGQVRGEYSYFCSFSSGGVRLHIKRSKNVGAYEYFGYVDVEVGVVEVGCWRSVANVRGNGVSEVCWSELAETRSFSCSDPCFVDMVVGFFIDRVVS